MRKYDKTTYKPERAERMARDTFSRLLQAKNLMAARKGFGSFRDAVPYEATAEDVSKWIRASKEDKPGILNRILYIIDNYKAPQKPKRRRPGRGHVAEATPEDFSS